MEVKNKKKGIVLLFGGAVLAALFSSAWMMFSKGPFPWFVRQGEYWLMAAEVAVVFAVLAAILVFVRKPAVRWGGAVAVIAVFCWAHVVFWPIVVGGLYLLYLVAGGRFLRTKVFRLPVKDGFFCDLLTGVLSVVAVFCLMSAVGAGEIKKLWIFVLVSGGLLLGYYASAWRDGRKAAGMGGTVSGWARVGGRSGLKGGYGNAGFGGLDSRRAAFCLAFILTALCIQAGRMNIAPDFDSLWYGLRAPYILDNGRGIYENLGTIGVVYTYSKGFEVLTLPLSVLPSYSFLLAFQLWLLAGCLACAYRIACSYMEHGTALFLTAMLAAVPGITNMAVTAKTDIATLLFQLIMISQLIAWLEEGKSSWRRLAYGFAAFFFTWTLKPTALVFSTAVMGMSVLFFLWKRVLFGGNSLKDRGNAEGWRDLEAQNSPEAPDSPSHLKAQIGSLGILALSLASLIGIWTRTVLITGLPVTSVFSSLLTKLGFTMKYPYNVSKIPNSAADRSVPQWCADMAKRAAGFLLTPQGEDMEHVILAWGGFFLLVMFLLSIAGKQFGRQARKQFENQTRKQFGKRTRKQFRNQPGNQSGQSETGSVLSQYLTVIYFPFLAVNIISLAMLTQVDGNYFMLLYVLTGVYAFHILARVKDRGIEKAVRRILLPVTVYLAIITTLTSWSWCLGFTPVSFRHAGYYNHMEAQQQRMEEAGNTRIWEILSADPQNRLIAVGDHPDVLAFPCSAQSYDDITGSWGNVVLVKKMDYFVEFMEYAKTDYVYAQAGYMAGEDRCYTLVSDLIEYGKLIPVLYENGNLLARVDTAGEYTENSRSALAEFQKCYIMKGNASER